MNQPKGAAILVAVIVISIVMLTLALSIGTGSIIENQINLYQSQSNKMLQNIDACGQESLIRLSRNSSYTGETLIVDNTTCTIALTGTGTNRTITVTGVNNNYTKKIQIGATIFPTLSVTSWQEITN